MSSTRRPPCLTPASSYTWDQASFGKLKHSLRVSVKNATDKIYYSPTFNPTDRRAFYFAYSVSH